MDKALNMDKLVSILLPSYNGVSRIRGAIKSVLDQSYVGWELLVLDDGSKDNLKGVVEGFTKNEPRIRYIKNDINLGIQKTLNKGLKEARGEYIARIDDDDAWADKDKLKKQIEFLEKNKDYVLVGTGVIEVDEKGKELFRYLVPESDKEIRNKILGKNCFVHSSVVIRKTSVMNLGGYSESVETFHIEDYDLWLKLGTVGELANLPLYAVLFTAREDSISSRNKVDQFKKILKLIKNYKNTYPHYYGSLFRSTARLLIYGFLIKLPIRFYLNKIKKIYKES